MVAIGHLPMNYNGLEVSVLLGGYFAFDYQLAKLSTSYFIFYLNNLMHTANDNQACCLLKLEYLNQLRTLKIYKRI